MRPISVFQSKFKDYWSTAIDCCSGDAKLMRHKLRRLLQPGASPVMDHSADDYALHFARKVENIRVSTAGAPPTVIKTRYVPEPLAAFSPVTSDEVKRSLGMAPAKHCILDSVPTWLLKRIDDVMHITGDCTHVQRIVRAMHSTSQAEDGGHASLTQEIIDGPDRPELLSANISFISKMVERMVDSRLIA